MLQRSSFCRLKSLLGLHGFTVWLYWLGLEGSVFGELWVQSPGIPRPFAEPRRDATPIQSLGTSRAHIVALCELECPPNPLPTSNQQHLQNLKHFPNPQNTEQMPGGKSRSRKKQNNTHRIPGLPEGRGHCNRGARTPSPGTSGRQRSPKA